MPNPLMPNPRILPRVLLAAGLGSGLLLVGCGGWLAWSVQHRSTKPVPKMVYTASGYGGFVPAPKLVANPVTNLGPGAKAQHTPPPDPVAPLREAYNAGHYSDMEAAAQTLVAQAQTHRSVAVQEQAAQAGSLLAYAAARRHDLKLARTRFAAARQEAARLPDKGKQAALPGEMAPTLEEDAAYEHAVCTNALGNSQAAEAEYLAFMKRYPESPLVSASVKRIARMHGGDTPLAAQAAWQGAQQIAQTRQQARTREGSLCGPECLAELLRRRGEAADVHALADAMHTSDRGTTLDALAAAARQRGYGAQGLALTQRGLSEQKLPVIALIVPGHYVLVEGVTASAVLLWDPDARGSGQGAARTVPLAIWQQQWQGTTLALTALQTAQR